MDKSWINQMDKSSPLDCGDDCIVYTYVKWINHHHLIVVMIA